MADPEKESARQDKFEYNIRRLLKWADDNRNYVVGGVIALILVGAAIYFKVAQSERVSNEAWAALYKSDTTGLLGEKWRKFGNTDAGPYIAIELASRLYTDQRETADKGKENSQEDRLAKLDEGIRVLTEAVERFGDSPPGEDLKTMLETFRLERDWVAKHGAEIAAVRGPHRKAIQPNPEKLQNLSILSPGEGKNPLISLITAKGVIEIELFQDDAPNHVANFISLALEGFYTGLIWHRVEDWVVQTGCPEGTGTGGPGYTIKFETSPLKHERGAVGMARSMDKDSAGSQFYICKKDQFNIDGEYVIFGRVVKGMDVVDALAKGDALNDVVVRKVRANKDGLPMDYIPTIVGGKPSQETQR